MLIKLLMGKRQYWLFKRQRQRLVSFDQEPIEYSNGNYNALKLLGWKPDEYLDKHLIKGFFGLNITEET